MEATAGWTGRIGELMDRCSSGVGAIRPRQFRSAEQLGIRTHAVRGGLRENGYR